MPWFREAGGRCGVGGRFVVHRLLESRTDSYMTEPRLVMMQI